ncbi:MAG: hypothetical protein C5S49_02065 [Candidatus Methanogaster sp.]|nr:MAG: hypothetical protein C5S49_02065 [ANME-2 cluster archaeon]
MINLIERGFTVTEDAIEPFWARYRSLYSHRRDRGEHKNIPISAIAFAFTRDNSIGFPDCDALRLT